MARVPLSSTSGGASLRTRTAWASGCSAAKLELAAPTEILTQATCLGTVQVPPGGQPIVLMADHQTTGGYPKIAEAIAADAPMLAQLAPGASLRFAAATLAEADAAREALCARVDTLVQRILWEFGDEGD